MLDVIGGAFVPRVGRAVLAPCLVAAAMATACGGVGDLPTDGPTLTPTTENFTGTMQKNGAAMFVFSEAVSGSITATLTTLSPQTDISLSFSIGTWDGIDLLGGRVERCGRCEQHADR